MKRFFLLLVLIPGFFSCKKEEENNLKQLKSEIKVVDEAIKLQIGGNVSPQSLMPITEVFSKENEQLIVYPSVANTSLYLFNTKNKKFEAFQFYEDGKNNLQDAFYANYYHSADSIFFGGQLSNRIFLTNYTGEINKTWILNKEKILVTKYSPFIMNIKESELIFPNYMYELNLENALSEPIYWKLNLGTDNIEPFGPKYSEIDYKFGRSATYNLPLTTSSQKKQEIYFCLNETSSLHVLSLESGEVVKTIELEVPDYIKYKVNIDKNTSFSEYNLTNFDNGYLSFNSTYDLFFLTIYHPIKGEFKDLKRGEEFYNREFTVCVYNKDFKLISYKEFEGGQYESRDIFGGKEGLYISQNNPLRKDYTEDSLKFALIKLDEQ